MKKQTLEALRMFLDYFTQHNIQARILFINFGLSLILFSTIVGIYTGQAFYDSIITFNCR